MISALAFAFAGWLFGGFVSGVAGFGGMMMALPVYTLAMSPTDAVLTCCLIGGPSCTQLGWLYRKHMVWADMKWLWLSCIPGCIAGALTLKVIPMNWLQIAISLMIAVFVILQLSQNRTTWRLPDSVHSLLITGFASGFANSTVSVVGVPIGIFVLLKKWDKDRARATMSVFFFFCCWMAMLVQWIAGLYTLEHGIMALSGLAGAFLGQSLGFRVGKNIAQDLFVKIILSFLSLASVTLFYKAL